MTKKFNVYYDKASTLKEKLMFWNRSDKETRTVLKNINGYFYDANGPVSKDKAKERLQLVLMQDRASVSPDFFEMMKKEIISLMPLRMR